MLSWINFYPCYVGLTKIIAPYLTNYFNKRCRLGKEEPSRYLERLGQLGPHQIPQPIHQSYIWFHAASNGEVRSVLPLLLEFYHHRPDLGLLITSSTKSAQTMMNGVLPQGAVHLYAPYDSIDAVTNFIAKWQPKMLVMVEQEIWPNMVMICAKSKIPLVLVNGRMSQRSYYFWRVFRASAQVIFKNFTLGFAMDHRQKNRLRHLGLHQIESLGDLKADVVPLPVDQGQLHHFKVAIEDRPIWFAASTHEGEEQIVIDVALKLKEKIPNLLVIIAPRKPQRLNDIVRLFPANIRYAIRSQQQFPDSEDYFFVVDSFGELGLFYSLAHICLLGGSMLVGIGGHNPMEAISFNCPLMMGQDRFNCYQTAQTLIDHDAMIDIKDEQDLYEHTKSYLQDIKLRQKIQKNQQDLLSILPKTATLIFDRLKPLLPSGS